MNYFCKVRLYFFSTRLNYVTDFQESNETMYPGCALWSDTVYRCAISLLSDNFAISLLPDNFAISLLPDNFAISLLPDNFAIYLLPDNFACFFI